MLLGGIGKLLQRLYTERQLGQDLPNHFVDMDIQVGMITVSTSLFGWKTTALQKLSLEYA